jgi:hypothetical protein
MQGSMMLEELSSSETVDSDLQIGARPESPPDNMRVISTEPQLFHATNPRTVIEPQSNSTDGSEDLKSEISCDESEIDIAISQLLQRSVLPDLRLQFPQILEQRRLEALMAGDYDKAEQCDKIMSIHQSLLQQAEHKQIEERSIDSLYQRWQKLQVAHQEITDKWDSKISLFLGQSQQKEIALQAKFDEEIEQFIAKWKDPAFLRPFNKPSVKLIQLREQERAMGLTRMYAQAKELKLVADRLQREETRSAQSRISTQMAAERQSLGVKQEKEHKSLAGYRDRALKAMQDERAKELRPITLAMQQMKAKKGSVTPKPGGADSGQLQEGGVSPETQARYAQFRSGKRTTLLGVAPVDDQVIAQMKGPSTTRRTTLSRGRTK